MHAYAFAKYTHVCIRARTHPCMHAGGPVGTWHLAKHHSWAYICRHTLAHTHTTHAVHAMHGTSTRMRACMHSTHGAHCPRHLRVCVHMDLRCACRTHLRTLRLARLRKKWRVWQRTFFCLRYTVAVDIQGFSPCTHELLKLLAPSPVALGLFTLQRGAGPSLVASSSLEPSFRTVLALWLVADKKRG